MGTTKDKRAAERNFHAKFDDGLAPEDVVIQAMLGTQSLQHRGKTVKISKTMLDCALALLPYRLPKLNSIDAEVRTVELSHEEWIASLDENGE